MNASVELKKYVIPQKQICTWVLGEKENHVK